MVKVGTFSGDGGSDCRAPYVITEGDETPAGNSNVYSAKRTILDFARKAFDEVITGLWNFVKGFTVGNYEFGKSGAVIDTEGNAEVGDLTVRGDASIGGDVDVAGDVDASVVTARDGLTVGDYLQGKRGAHIDSSGNAEVESIESRSWLKVRELIYNRLNALEGDTSFADVGTIDSISDNSDGTRTAAMRKRWEGDITAFQPGDVVYGYVNNLDNTAAVEYGKAWAWVKSVDRHTNTLTLVAYPDSEVPAGKNLPATAGMVITRRGNNVAPSAVTAANPDYSSFIIKRKDGYVNTRQSSFTISTEQGNIVQLTGVDKPVIDRANYGTVLGRIPAGLLPPALEELVNPDHPYLYARGIFVEDIIRIGYEGVPVRTENYRGVWDAATATDPTAYYRNTTGTYDTVTWRGAMWQNLVSGTTEEPDDASAAWLRMTGTQSEARGLWNIIPNAAQIAVRADGTSSPATLTCTVGRHTVDGDYVYADRGPLDAQGVELLYAVDGGALRPFTMGAAMTLMAEDGVAPLASEDGTPWVTEGDDMATSGIATEVRFELCDTATGDTLARVTVPVIRDGQDGKDGEPGADGADGKDGKDGATGPIAYPSGIFDPTETYNGTAGSVPIVEYDGQYYVLRGGKTYNATDGTAADTRYPTPAENVAHYSTGNPNRKWDLLDKFKAVYADIIMADFAKLSSAVFYGDYMFSQKGRDADGNITERYQDFALDETGNPTGAFTPEWWVNLRTGQSYMRSLDASSGRIGRLSVDMNGGMHNSTTDTTQDAEWDDMDLTVTGLDFTHVVRDPASTALTYSIHYGQTASASVDGNSAQPRPVYDISINGKRDHSYGIRVNITDGTKYPHALYGRGNVTMDGVVTGYGAEVITMRAANSVHTGTYRHGTWLVTNTASGASLMLPSRTEVASQLGISSSAHFAVRLAIVGTVGCTRDIDVWGRNAKLTGLGFNTDAYPIRLTPDGVYKQDNGLAVGKGDVLEFMLVWDGTGYYAYQMNYST